MTRETHRQALMAAARIACAAALVGCAKDRAPETAAAPDELTLPPPGQLTLSNPERAACEQLVDEAFQLELAFPIEGAPQSEWDAYYAAYQEKLAIAKGDAEITACCQSLTSAFDSFDAATEWGHRDSCCDVLDWQSGSLACTPWGPPTPPAMPGEA